MVSSFITKPCAHFTTCKTVSQISKKSYATYLDRTFHSFITEIYIAPPQSYYSEALPKLARLKRAVFRLEYKVSEGILGSNRCAKGSPFHTVGPATENSRAWLVEVRAPPSKNQQSCPFLNSVIKSRTSQKHRPCYSTLVKLLRSRWLLAVHHLQAPPQKTFVYPDIWSQDHKNPRRSRISNRPTCTVQSTRWSTFLSSSHRSPTHCTSGQLKLFYIRSPESPFRCDPRKRRPSYRSVYSYDTRGT